jgi:predicted DNA-binding transcriptional regulator YafY
MGTTARTLQLLSLLQGQRYWPGAELAARLEVSPRTLRRDVEELRELGYPVQAHRGVDGGYQLAAGAALPPLVLDDDEAVALAVGLHAAASSAVAGTAEASVRALAKVVQVMPVRLRRRVDALRVMTVAPPWEGRREEVDPLVLTALAQACRDDERVELDYTTKQGLQSRRTVEPHRLVPLGRRWYLVAYDLGRHDWRSFRLDRLAHARGDGSRFRQRELPAADAAAFVRAGIRTVHAVWEVAAVLDAPAADVQARLGRWASVVELDDRKCRVQMTTDTLDWAALLLGSSGAELSEVTPPELLEHLRSWGDRFARATAATTGSSRPASS